MPRPSAVRLALLLLWAAILAWCAAPPGARADDLGLRAPQGRAAEMTERGARLIRRGDSGSAVWFLREALLIDPAHSRAAALLADIYFERGDVGSAATVVRQGLERAPSRPELWVRLARSHAALGDLAGELAAIREGLRWVPEDASLLRALVGAAMRTGHWLTALAALRGLADQGQLHGESVAADASLQAALQLLVGSSDRARGVGCQEQSTTIRRALAGCELR